MNVGDKVTLKNDLVIGQEYGGVKFTEDMEELKGKTLTIAMVYVGRLYYVRGSFGLITLTEEMFNEN